MARAMHARPGESAEEFKTRRHRARLLATDRDECARLDKRMPVEQASLNNPDRLEVLKAEAALGEKVSEAVISIQPGWRPRVPHRLPSAP